jgi:hypothetical protein
MYCPNCGQQQLSEEMRFCSRCGLALSGLAEWLSGGGVPAKRESETQLETWSPRREGMRRAAKLMFFSGVLVPVFLVVSLIFDKAGPMIVPIVVFFVSLVMLLYARLFSEKSAPVKQLTPQGSRLAANPTRASLPPPTNMPIVGVSRQQVGTKEMAQRPSVTEHTTRILDNE